MCRYSATAKTIAHLDFYELLVKGDKSKDIRLQSGDVLYLPVQWVRLSR